MKFEIGSQTIFCIFVGFFMLLKRFFKIFSLLFVLVVAGVLFLFPSVRNTIVIKSSDVLTIFDQAISIPFSVIESRSNDIKNLSKINDENISLKSKIYQIDINHSKLNRLESENKELKDLLNLKNSVSGSKQVVGEIVDRNYSSWNEQFVIDKGSSDGISDSMFVLSSGGVIGVVDNLEKNSSRIKLLVGNDISSQHLTLKIEDKTQSIFALLIGFDDKTGEFRLLQIGDSVDIKKGSLVSTSGLGKYKTSDLPVGTVSSVKKASDQLGQEIRVKPKASLDVNRYVLLIGE